MAEHVTNITSRALQVVPDPCGESAVRQQWLEIRKQFDALNRADQLFDANGNLVFNGTTILDDARITNLSVANLITYPGETIALLGPLFIWFEVYAVHSQTSIEVTITEATVEVVRHLGVDENTRVGSVGSAQPVYISPSGHFGTVAVGDKGVAHWCQLGLSDSTATGAETTNCWAVIWLDSNRKRSAQIQGASSLTLTSSYQTVPMGDIEDNGIDVSDLFTVSLPNDDVTILVAGSYDVEAYVGFSASPSAATHATTTRFAGFVKIQRFTGGLWSDLEQSAVSIVGWVQDDTQTVYTSVRVQDEFVANDKVRIVAGATDASPVELSDGICMTERIFITQL